jgi:hypothetical protein
VWGAYGYAVPVDVVRKAVEGMREKKR